MFTAFIIYILFLLAYFSFVGTTLWYVKKDILLNDASRWAMRIFLLAAALMLIISLVLFLWVPWNNLTAG